MNIWKHKQLSAIQKLIACPTSIQCNKEKLKQEGNR